VIPQEDFVVKFRYGGEPRDVRELVQPYTYLVDRVYNSLPTGTETEVILAAWDYVCRHVNYPPSAFPDYHKLEAFLRSIGPWTKPLLVYTDYEIWHTPSETLWMGWGDCEDTAILLVSLLRKILPADRVFVAIGLWNTMGHGWPVVYRNGQGYILESTFSEALSSPWEVPEGDPYKPWFAFNDQEVRGDIPGFLQLRGKVKAYDEALKNQQIHRYYRDSSRVLTY